MGALPRWAALAGLVIASSQCFNVETERPTVFLNSSEEHFGYVVRQFGPEGFLVSAPKARIGNVTGAIYKCDSWSRACNRIPIPASPEANIVGVGLSLTADSSSPPKLLVCAPSLSYSCGQNTYINGICYQFDSTLTSAKNLTPAYQGCPKAMLDIAFLIDGSGSISNADFQRVKNFMLSVIKLLKDKDVQFAVAQFSDEARTEFDFDAYGRSANWEQLIDRVRQMNSVTFTPTGIKHVTEKIFDAERGARPEATSVMIVVTDGESNDVQVTFDEAIRAADAKKILRYAIGVGDAFSTDRATKELDIIASKPSKDFVFKADNFAALEGLNDRIKDKIFAIEGTGQSSGESTFKLELAQVGFSSLFTSDSITLGAVGAYDWAGALVEMREDKTTVVNISATGDMVNAYLGYSLAEARRQGQRYCLVGAPRYKHVGQVMVFRRDPRDTSWSVEQNIEGQQIGSYFGMELLAVDLEGDGETDWVMIGAPLYHEAGVGGQVWLCTVSAQGNFSCHLTLRGKTGDGLGRFGSALAALGDLNGDGLREVAVGAPLEDGHRGCVYIYRGSRTGIGPGYSQRIAGSRTAPELKYFGTSIDGRMDLTRDGLTDLLIGARGGAVILRSAPVLRVTANLTFEPAEIPLAAFECSAGGSGQRLHIDLHLCFRLEKMTRDGLGSLSASLNYTLALDEGRQESRAEFGAKGRTSASQFALEIGDACQRHRVNLLACIEDYYNPIEVTLQFCAEGNTIHQMNNLKPAIEEKCANGLSWKIPFEKNCGTDEVCLADLDVVVKHSGLTVQPGAQVNLTVQLKNMKESSYHTTVRFQHPQTLSFRRVTILKSNRRLVVGCVDSVTQGILSITKCTVGQPVFRENAEVIFILTLDVSNANTLNDSVRVVATAQSDNEEVGALDNNRVTLNIPVRHRVNLLLQSLNSTNYVNFSLGVTVMKEVRHQYKIENLSRRPIPVNVTFIVPEYLTSRLHWNVSGVTTEKTPTKGAHCHVQEKVRGQAAVVGSWAMQTHKDCQAETCQVMLCQVNQLARNAPLTFALRGSLSVTNSSQIEPARYQLQSVAELQFDRMKFTQAGDDEDKRIFHHINVTTELELFKELDYIPWIAAGAAGGFLLLIVIGLILLKLGFFKRNYKARLNEGSPGNGAAADEGCTEPLNSGPVTE